MGKLLNISLSLILGAFALSSFALPSYAQESEDYSTTSYDDYTTTSYDDWDWEYDYDLDTAYDTDYASEDLSEGVAALLGGAGLVFGGIALVISIVMSLALYVYSSMALMAIAKKLNAENAWFAWVPILNMILLFRIGDQKPLLLLLLLIPGIGAFVIGIFSIIALMKVCEKRGYDKLLGLLSLVPVANLILLGVLAWGKK